MTILQLSIALAVYTRSPAAYSALKSFDILQLPSVSSLKHFTGANIEDPGEAEDRLLMCREQYEKHVVEMVAKGKKKPLGEGALIIDEVKVLFINVSFLVTSSYHNLYRLQQS